MGIFLGDQLTNIISTARYIHDVPFLCFLANLYVGARLGQVTVRHRGKVPIERTVYRLNFTCESLEPILDLRDVEVAKADLQARISRPVGGATYSAKNRPTVHPSHPRRRSVEDIEESPDNAQIEVTVFDCIHGPGVIRYIKLVPETYFLDGSGVHNFLCPCCSGRVRVAAIDPNGYAIPGKRDIVDLIFSEVHTPEGDSWMCRSKSWNIFKNDSHIFDEIDRHIRTRLNISFTGFEFPDLS